MIYTCVLHGGFALIFPDGNRAPQTHQKRVFQTPKQSPPQTSLNKSTTVKISRASHHPLWLCINHRSGRFMSVGFESQVQLRAISEMSNENGNTMRGCIAVVMIPNELDVTVSALIYKLSNTMIKCLLHWAWSLVADGVLTLFLRLVRFWGRKPATRRSAVNQNS